MSKTAKIWTAIIVILIIIIVSLSVGKSGHKAMTEEGAVVNSATTSAVVNDSDAALNQDLSNVDVQMNALNTDSANVDQSLK